MSRCQFLRYSFLSIFLDTPMAASPMTCNLNLSTVSSGFCIADLRLYIPMPLLRRKPFALAEPPNDLEPCESLFRIRFTKEVFRDYKQKFMGGEPASFQGMLPLKDLVDSIADKLKEQLVEGSQLYGKKNERVCPCKILRVMQKDAETVSYVVAWLDESNNVIERAEVSSQDLVQKKPPFSRNILKSFVRECTYRNAPWVLHDKLAKNHGISTDIPEELRGKVSFNNGLVVFTKKRKHEEESIKYPIDDLLVKPSPDDPVFSSRPSPSRDFNVPIHCVGDLLTVWDFLMSFGKLLQLSPYSLKDFENAICHKDSNVVLLVESLAVLFRVLIKGDDEYYAAVQDKLPKKITMISWKDYLCKFLEMIKIPKLQQYEATIKRGRYSYVDVNAKLEIFCELVNRALDTAIVREKLHEFIEQRRVLGAAKREEAIEASAKRRKVKEQLKADSGSTCGENGHDLDQDATVSADNSHRIQNGSIRKNRNSETESSTQKYAFDSGIKHSNLASKMSAEKFDSELNRSALCGKVYNRKESQKQPIGMDRYYNRYWWFYRDGRIFVESPESNEWGYYSSKGELDGLTSSLNCKGERERALLKQLKKYYGRICSELQKNSKDLLHKTTLDDSVVRRSTRVRAPPRKNPAKAFLRYVNKWKEE
ncbi:uncharacterized protein HKW66_Vig0080450 [Vigna angularis]|uniref:DDT domain-containing protein n=1 Tax=Phaseolus angularis TaxID=3914 RepID=A0A8T0KM83_PHAAN|nr:uncharacterized protein HKW66_Vig0080450 [Vigna angularis]